MAPVLGTTVGAYRLQEIVARDALGTVHRAQDERTGRQALIRFLEPLAGDSEALRRFKIELPAIAALHHPGIVPVEGWGEADGVPYVVTPLVAAQRLSDLLAGGRRPDPWSALGVIRGAAAALDYAHRSGVVHGSLEPSRMLVAADGSAQLADVGLALVVNASAGVSDAGPSADVYALAAIARELLLSTGRPLPPAVDEVLRRGLEPDPDRRWQSGGELVAALEAALAGREAAAARPAPVALTRLRELLDRRWIAPGAAVLLLLVLVVTLAVHWLRPGPTLELTPGSARPGDSVTVTGQHLPPGQPGTVAIEGRPGLQTQFTADGGGTFIVSITIPQDQAGDPTIQACWGGSCPLSQVLHLLAAPSPPTTAAPTPIVVQPTPTPTSRRVSPSISVKPQAPRRGQTIKVSGRGFDPQAQYQVVLDQSDREWILQQSTSPDGDGAFTASVVVPGDARRGVAVVVACVEPAGPVPACARQPIVISG